MTDESHFHEGERAMQERAGEVEIADRNGVILGDAVTPRAWAFLAQQRMLAVASEDAEGAPWASLLFGDAGMATTIDGHTLVLRVEGARALEDDPLANLRAGSMVGLLAIDLSTRRRLRINGRVTTAEQARVEIAVRESFPNCPKYIQRRRRIEVPRNTGEARATVHGTALDRTHVELLARIDTAFVASRHPERGLDASHRGGPRGFVRARGDRTLRIPDYAGNSMFNTLGNVLVDPAAGLTAVDFEGGRLLRMTGRAQILFDEPDPDGLTGGTNRFWELAIDRVIDSPLPPAIGWEYVDASPFNP